MEYIDLLLGFFFGVVLLPNMSVGVGGPLCATTVQCRRARVLMVGSDHVALLKAGDELLLLYSCFFCPDLIFREAPSY